MSLTKVLLAIIRATTGRKVQVGQGVPALLLFRYAAQQGLSLCRGVVAQLLAARRPRALYLGAASGVFGLRLLAFGPRLRLGQASRITCWSRNGIEIGQDFSLGEHSFLSNGFNPFGDIGSIRIGSHVGIGAFSYICCPSSLTIGDNVITGQYLSIHAQNHVFTTPGVPIRLQGTTSLGVHVGADCWIGAKVTILDGVTIGAGSIIAAGAVVNQSFPEYSIIGGVPARAIGKRPHAPVHPPAE